MTQNKVLVIGVTGPIASGKSTLSSYLQEKYNAFFIDADKVGHEILFVEAVKEKLEKEFGREIFGADGEIERKKLGALVFGEPEKLAVLNGITHPAIIAEILQRIEAVNASLHPLCVLEAIGLFETELKNHTDANWVVSAPYFERIRRMRKTRGQTLKEAVKRIKSQPKASFYTGQADAVFSGTGAKEKLYEKCDRELAALRKKADERN